MADIVSLRGAPIEPPAQPAPQAQVVTMLEELLEAAKAGNISAIALAWCLSDDTVSRGIVGNVQSLATLRMIGGVELLKGQITRLFDDPSEDTDPTS